MADIDPAHITKLMEEKATSYASVETQARELAAMTGLSMDVARSFFRGLNPRGGLRAVDARGYKKGEFPKKKAPKAGGS